MSKTDAARQVVARALLGVPIGAQLPTTTELSTSAHAGNGTIQTALKSLEGSRAIATTAHGSQGRRLVACDILALWAASGRGSLTGIMPLPESREFAGIATAFTEVFARAGLPLQLLFRQGSSTRMSYMHREVADFSVLSLGAAKQTRGEHHTLRLGPYTYYSRDAVVVITAKGQSPRPRSRVAVDRNSIDHTMLTMSEFPDAELVSTPYLFIGEAVANGVVDAAVWHRTTSSPLMTAEGLSVHEYSSSRSESHDEYNEAAVAWRQSDAGVGRLLKDVVDADEIRSIQKEVMDGQRVPQF